jgi:hypothetical protein
MQTVACEKRDPESKGVTEGGVRYVKYNALTGRDEMLTHFEDYQVLARTWRDSVANERVHANTRVKPIDRFEKERRLLRPLPGIPYDTDEVIPAIVTPHARVRFDTNRYSVPPEFVRKTVTLRVDDHSLRVLHAGVEIARHRRSFEKHKIVLLPEHRDAAKALRRRSQAHQIEAAFDALGPPANTFRLKLLQVPVKPLVHLRRLLEMVRLYGKAEVLQAITCALEYQTFDAAYVKNLIDQARRRRHLPSPLPLSPQRKELLEDILIEEPDPRHYDTLLGLE